MVSHSIPEVWPQKRERESHWQQTQTISLGLFLPQKRLFCWVKLFSQTKQFKVNFVSNLLNLVLTTTYYYRMELYISIVYIYLYICDPNTIKTMTIALNRGFYWTNVCFACLVCLLWAIRHRIQSFDSFLISFFSLKFFSSRDFSPFLQKLYTFAYRFA